MTPTRRELLAVSAGSLAIAGCLGGGTDMGGDGDSTATVQVRQHAEFGEILVDAEGMTLYLFDADTKGSAESACHDDCADAWPPLTVGGDATAGPGVTATLSTFERADGTTQVAAEGWPLYYFASDGSPGDVNGQGVNDVWWVLGPDGTKITEAGGSDGREY